MDKSQMNPLSYYNFIEEKSFEPHVYDVQISADDKIISVTEDGKLLGSVALDIENNILSLIGKDGEKFSSAELPLVDVITDAYYDEERTSLVIVVKLSDGTDKEILVPFNDLLDDYAKKEEVDAVSDSLETEVQDRAEKDEELKALIEAEIINRKNADTAIESKLDNEVNSLKKADANINAKLDTKVEWTDISDSKNPNRKSIILNNHDCILGTNTKGSTSNLVMLSKWNVADFGSKSTHINLNGLYERPTYNDSKPMALIEDVTNLQDSINTTIQTLHEKDTNLQEQINLLSGSEGELTKELEALKAKDVELDNAIEAEENTRSAKDIELQGNIEAEATTRLKQDTLINQRINDLHTNTEGEIVDIKNLLDEVDKKIQAETTERKAQDNLINQRIDDLHTNTEGKIVDIKNLLDEVDKKIQTETTERIKEDGLLQESLDKKVEWTDISDSKNPNRKSIILNNHDCILGKSTKGGSVNIAMMSKWDKVDLGSASVELNLNGSAIHPTYNDKEEIAFISDITTSSVNFTQEINDLKAALESEISTRSKKDTELQNNIVTESSERQTKDNELNEKIDNLHQNTEGELTSINDLINSIELVKDEDNDLIYHLIIGETDKGTINIPKDQFLSQVKYDPISNILTFIIEGAEAKSTVSVDLNDLVDTYFAGDGLMLNEKRTFTINIDPTSEEYLTLSTNGLKLSGIDEKFATKVELSQEVSRAKGEEAKLLGTISDTEEVMSLYGVKKYASNNQGEIADINIKINTIESNFDNYVTKQEAVEQHDDIITQAKSYTDTKVEEEKAATITEAVNKSKEYTDSKVSTIEKVITSNTDRITNVEDRCDHFDDLFGMILDEHGEPVELKFYTKSEIDTKVEALNNKDTELLEKLDKKVEWVDIATGDNPNRKSIVLENHDTILGKDTKGGTVNIAMVSKWDVVDLGTTTLPINLNTPKGVRPTVQEAGQTGEEANKIAYLSDLQNGIYSLGEVESFNNLDEKAAQKGICDNQDNVILTFKITTVPYGKESGFILNIRNGNKISQALYWKQALEPEMYRELTIDENGDIANIEFTPNSNRTLYKDSLPNQTIFTLTTETDSETIKTALTDVLHGGNPITKEQLDDCLKYGYYLLESSMRVPVYVGWNGSSYTLTMFGLPNPKGELIAATVAFSINEDNTVYTITRNGSRSTILTSSNIENNSSFINLQSTDNLLASKIAVLEEKLAKLSKTNIEEISLNEGSGVSFDDETKDYVVSGSETKSTTIVGKTVKLDNLTISNNARTNIKANDVEIKGVKLSGDFPKANGNSVININNAEYIVVKDMIFDSSNVYNGIEIGLSSETLPKSILFENCKFLGQFSNNAILIFGTQANAVININNCYFENLSNPFRLSNNKNTSCTMNITNCKIDKWDVNSPWQGMMLLQDYNSGDAEKANTNNLFAPEKITINVINTIGPNNKKIAMPSDIATVCGTGDDKQLFYVWDNYRNLVPYDKSKYPTINIL